MQRAQDRPPELVPEPISPRPGVSPAIAFSMLAILVAVIAAAVFLTRPDTEVQAAATNPTSTSPNFALTNEEAIARFKELSQMLHQAYAMHDPTRLDHLYTDASPVRELAGEELRQLNRDQVSDVSTYKTLRVEVVANTDDSIRLREVVMVKPRFVDRAGKDVTTSKSDRIREVVEWTLRPEGGIWLIHDAVVEKSEPF